MEKNTLSNLLKIGGILTAGAIIYTRREQLRDLGGEFLGRFSRQEEEDSSSQISETKEKDIVIDMTGHIA